MTFWKTCVYDKTFLYRQLCVWNFQSVFELHSSNLKSNETILLRHKFNVRDVGPTTLLLYDKGNLTTTELSDVHNVTSYGNLIPVARLTEATYLSLYYCVFYTVNFFEIVLVATVLKIENDSWRRDMPRCD